VAAQAGAPTAGGEQEWGRRRSLLLWRRPARPDLGGVAAAQTGAVTMKGDRAGVGVGHRGRGAATEAPTAEAVPGTVASPATERGLGGDAIGREGATGWGSGGRPGGPRTDGCGWSWGVTLGFLM
jgi:hypothetical protein